VFTPFNPRTRIVIYDHYGPRYRTDGYTCRFENLNVGDGACRICNKARRCAGA
jgi:hypothetical protein